MSTRDYLEKDYYQILGVAGDASREEIAKAYRKLALQLHPDVWPTGEERFKQVSEAHAVLADPGKRKEYDQVRAGATKGTSRGGTAGAPIHDPHVRFGSGRFAPARAFDDFSKVFDDRSDPDADPFRHDDLGVGWRSREGPYRYGRDVEIAMTLSPTEARNGVTATLSVPDQLTCPRCQGSGVRSVSGFCPVCDGAGLVIRGWGLLGFAEACPACAGRGRYAATACGPCRGSGWVACTREIRVRIPAMVRHGTRICLHGRGERGSGGGPPGNLYVTVRVRPV